MGGRSACRPARSRADSEGGVAELENLLRSSDHQPEAPRRAQHLFGGAKRYQDALDEAAATFAEAQADQQRREVVRQRQVAGARVAWNKSLADKTREVEVYDLGYCSRRWRANVGWVGAGLRIVVASYGASQFRFLQETLTAAGHIPVAYLVSRSMRPSAVS